MTLQNSIFKNRSGQFYKVILPRENNAQLSLKPESFWNESSAQQFIQNLTVPNGYWRDIIHQYSTTPCPSSLTINDIDKQVCALMMQDQIKFYPIDIPDITENPPENRVIKTEGDILYRFIPMSSLLIIKNANVKYFDKNRDTEEFIKNLNSDDEKLKTIATELKLKVPNTATVNKDEVIKAISAALVAGSIVIIEDKVSSPPPDESKVVETKDSAGNRRADTVAAPVDEYKEINIDLLDEFDKNAAAFFKLFDDLEYTLKTDQGDEHKGKISNGKIHIPKAKMSSNFELEIKDLPAFMEG